MNTKFNTKNVLAKGFSLVEMLVVIAVIGIIAAIAIPSIGSITTSAGTATAQRNAQNLCSVYQTGKAANVAWTGSDAATVVASVVAGGTGLDGARFAVDGLSSTAQGAAVLKLTYDATKGLVYNP